MIMGNKRKPYFACTRNDDYNTPICAWEFLLQELDDVPKRIWAPFYYDGSIKSTLKQINLDIIHEDKDFFTWTPEQYDVIIDNCPFSIKKQILRKCLDLQKPFALLLPIDTLERKYIANMFGEDNKFQVLIPKQRYNFCNNKKSIPFKSVWFCYDMKLRSTSQLIFER